MNLTINELERRLYVTGRLQERAALLEFEYAWHDAEWNRPPESDGMLSAEDVARVGFSSMRSEL